MSVLAGAGEHAGMIRIVAGNAFGCFRAGGLSRRVSTVRLRLPVPGGVPETPHEAVPVECDWHDDWLEFTLPDWARAKAAEPSIPAPPRPINAPPPLPPAKQPYVSLSSREPDPAAQNRVEARKVRS